MKRTSFQSLLALKLVFATLLLSLYAQAQNLSPWDQASNGQSSFRTLGDDYSVSVPVRQVKGARVVLLNQELANKLGLTANSKKELEKLIIERFAVNTSNVGDSKRTMFATRYQDYEDKDLEKLGSPDGDGRSLWAGELQYKSADGSILYVDIGLKGTGRTPLAREELRDDSGKVKNAQYSDGLQDMYEAIRGFIASNLLAANGIDTVQDLAVIELPLKKYNRATKRYENAALTVRVGGQTRIGHLRRFAKDPAKLAKISEYILRRELHLPMTAEVTRADYERYIHNLAVKLGEEAANFEDMNFLHGSPTAGNQTTSGMPIDFGTFETFDAFHGNYKYLYKKLYLKDRADSFRLYLSLAGYYLHGPNFRWTTDNKKKYEEEFWNSFHVSLAEKYLRRLGLTAEQIDLLHPDDVENFFSAARDLYLAQGKEPKEFYAGTLVPAAFDLRSILKESMRTMLTSGADLSPSWISAFIPNTKWNTLSRADFVALNTPSAQGQPYRDLAINYLHALRAVYDRLATNNVDFTAIIDRAASQKNRKETTFTGLTTVADQMSKFFTNPAANSKVAEDAMKPLIDWPSSKTLLQSISTPPKSMAVPRSCSTVLIH